MKNLSTIFAMAALLSTAPAAFADGNNWMSTLPDNVYITQLSLPGTHDAATSSITTWPISSYSKTQTYTVSDQWDKGVRVFDLRPKTEGADAPIYHGSAKTGKTLRGELGNIKNKLVDNPREFAIVIMRNESNGGQEGDAATGKWHNTIAPILAEYDDFIIAWNPNLTLADVRGKILILTRDEVVGTKATKILGIDNWGDNVKRATTLLNDDGAFHLILQDYYNDVNLDEKKNAIKDLLDEAMTIHCPNRLYINYASGYTGSGVSTNIGECAKATNKYICEYLDSHSGGPTGIIMMDFAGDNSYSGQTLIDKIIANNNSLVENFSGPAGEYYLQNVATGEWIQGYQAIAGADRDRWNTAANMGSYGRPFRLENPDKDGWTFNTLAGDEKLGCEYGDGGLLYLDWDGHGCPTRWKITGTKDNAYITINHDRWLSVDESTPHLLIKDGTTRNAWKLWTRDERIAALSAASETNPIDATWLLINPELMNNDHRTPQWQIERRDGGEGWQDGFRPNRIFETWNYTKLDFYQTIDVPNGIYEVQAYALFSPTEMNVETSHVSYEDYKDYADNGDATVNGYLYANGEKVKLPSIYSFTSPTPVVDYAAKDLGNGVSIVDGLWQAARAMGEDGKFHSKPLRVVVHDGSLRLGIREDNNSGNSHWIIIGSFSLKYLGSNTASEPTTTSVTIGSNGYATFASPKPLDLSALPNGLTAYKVVSLIGDAVLLEPITTAVPAGTGVLFAGTPNQTYELPITMSAPELSDNLLVGVTEDTFVSAGNYLFNGNDFTPISERIVLHNGTAYLGVTSSASVISILTEVPTQIAPTPIVNKADGEYYNLLGQRISNPTRGLYIKDGKLILK